MNLRWRNVLLVVLAIVAMAYSRAIASFLRSLTLGSFLQGFVEEAERMPRQGKFTVVVLVLALLYISAYMLTLNWVRRK
jgi:uncharacterized membrane protein YbaN (DUF454 family)